MMKRGSTEVCEPIKRLIIKKLKKSGFDSEENRKDLYDWVFTGINQNFYGDEGGQIQEPEKEFLLESKEPLYKLKGFIDKCILYDNKAHIFDYKSQKMKFKGDDLTGNIQALSYVLAAKKFWPKIPKVVVEFLLLRFPRKPSQQVEFTNKELKGFEQYLAYCYNIINNFTEKLAVTNFAADKPDKRGLCQSKSGSWTCPYLKPVDYWVSLDKDGEIIKSSFTEIQGEKVEKRHYDGCPRWQGSNSTATPCESNAATGFF